MTHRRTQERSGVVLVPVLVCLMIVASLAASLLRSGFVRRDQARAEAVRLQADWLAESGLERAATALRRDPGYLGETWKLSADDLGGQGPGEVLIAVEPAPGATGRRIVRARAIYPADAIRSARRTKQVTLDLAANRPEDPSS